MTKRAAPSPIACQGAPDCPCLPVPGATLCAIHQSFTRRQPGDVAVHCYACGELIRIGRRWMVRAEGAFHARAACLVASPRSYAIKVA